MQSVNVLLLILPLLSQTIRRVNRSPTANTRLVACRLKAVLKKYTECYIIVYLIKLRWELIQIEKVRGKAEDIGEH